MRTKAGIMILVGLLFLTVAAAAEPLSATINTSNPWIVASGSDQATITVNVKNTSYNTNTAGASVVFTTNDPVYGSFTSSGPVVTDANGNAAIVFGSGTRSGIVRIQAVVSYSEAGSFFTTTTMLDQHIDHWEPKSYSFDCPSQVPAGSVARLNVTLSDRFGNRIDNRNPSQVHTVTLTMSGDGGSGIWNGATYAPQVSFPTDSDGNVSANVRVSSLAGSNPIILSLSPIGETVNANWNIESVADVTPVTLTQLPPSPTFLPADGIHFFSLYFLVKDKYGNPLDSTDLWINSSAGESILTSTSNGGVAYAQYGPKDLIGTYTITVRAVQNSSILCSTGTLGYCSQNLNYYSQDPVDMILTASPQTLVSLDIDGSSQSAIQARVVDILGNPVQNESVVFTMGAESFPGGPYNETTASRLAQGTPPLTIQTDSNGFANVQFIPGRFSNERSTSDFNATATGVRTVTASWTNRKTGEVKRSDISFNWKNYPYFTVTSSVDKTSAKVGDPLRVSIVVAGNGAALQPKPIDVVLCLDRSGSMLENTTATDDNMVVSKTDANNFARCLTYGKDQIGIVSFGDNSATHGWVNLSPVFYPATKRTSAYYDWSNVYGYWYWVARDSKDECGTNCDGSSGSPYDPTSPHQQYLNSHYNNGNPVNYGVNLYSVDLPFGANSAIDVGNALNGVVPSGGTPTREGLSAAVSMFPQATSGRVRAIILQTDGAFTSGHDPMTSPSVIAAANSSKIAIYTIGLGVDSTTRGYLQSYATQTAGKYYDATDPSQLNQIYSNIAGDLNQLAGGSTVLNLNLGTIHVDNSVVDAGRYLDYMAVPIGGRSTGVDPLHDSTYVNMFHSNSGGSTTTYYTYTRDDTRNWTPGRIMDFSIGTIKLGDTWQTTFQFNLTENGTLVLFGPNSPSTISFTDSSTGLTQTSTLDSKTVSVYQPVVTQGFGLKSLIVDHLQFIGGSPDPDIWTIQWNTTYTGASKAVEKVEYLSSEPGSQWMTVPASIADKPPSSMPISDSLSIDTSLWKQDTTYTIRVSAIAANNDASPSSASIGKMKSMTLGNPFIKLE